MIAQSGLSYLLKSFTGTGSGGIHEIPSESPYRSFQLSSTGTTTLTIQVSNDGKVWGDYLSMSCTNTTNDLYMDISPWKFIKINVSSNTGAATLTVGW